VVLAGTLVALDDRRDTDGVQPASIAAATCGRSLRVVTSSSFAPVLTEVAPSLARGEGCVRLDTTVVDGRGAASRLAPLDADVWIPDDVSWASTAPRGLLADEGTAEAGTVLATSPIYMVTDRPTATRLQRAGGSWLALANFLKPGSGVRLAVREPARSGDGMVAAGSVAESVWLTKGMDASALMLATAKPVTRTVTEGGAAMPDQPGEVGLVPEHALLSAMDTVPPDAVIMTGSDRTALLRFAWMPTAKAAADDERAAALARLRDALTGNAGAEALAAARLRPPSAPTASGPGASRLPRTSAKPFDVLLGHHVDHVFASWYAEDRRSDILVAIDVSGSMADLAPGTRTPLMTLVQQGCRQLNAALPGESRLGLWEFGVGLDGPRDHRALVPVRELTQAHRNAFLGSVSTLRPLNTGTGLHDTILAAYLAAQKTYRPGTPNLVLVFTDGRNEDDPRSISMAQLSAALTKAADPARPVSLTVVAFGSKPEGLALQKALKPVFGYVQTTNRPSDVPAAFVHAAAGGGHH